MLMNQKLFHIRANIIGCIIKVFWIIICVGLAQIIDYMKG